MPCVFVVDDDEVIRRNIVKNLTRMNCRVRDFASGEALLQFFEQCDDFPDVILLDYKMEGMNGVETLKAVREKNPSVPVFIFTAYAGGMDMRVIQQLGHCEVMVKTVDLISLRQIANGARAIKALRQAGGGGGRRPDG